jgi:hypothetical protein
MFGLDFGVDHYLKSSKMSKKSVLASFGILLFSLSFGQDQFKYSDLVNEARKLYENKEYFMSGQKYSEAFSNVNNFNVSTNDRIAAASSWAQANAADSAFSQLFRVAQDSTFIYYNYLIYLPDFDPLNSDKRWNIIIGIVKANFAKTERNLDMSLVAILDTVYLEDQKSRQKINVVANKYGWQSEETKSFRQIMVKKDSLNLIRVEKILNERGWLGEEIIGHYGNLSIFLVIQHSGIETQIKYLPMMREAVKKGNAFSGNLALLEDRVALRQGKKQIYGSQIERDEITGESYVLPLEDPDNVDQRRAEAGLDKLQDYLSTFGMKWDVEEYKKKLPSIEAKQKNKN